jgi:enoyl-CoA hydratase
LPEVKLGYIPSAGGTQTLPRLIPPGIAREMIFSGEPIDAPRALELGLVQRVVPASELDRVARIVASELAATAQTPLRAAKEAMAGGADLPIEQALRLEAAIAERLAQGAAE